MRQANTCIVRAGCLISARHADHRHTRPRRRSLFSRNLLRIHRNHHRGNLFQHLHDRIPGGHHRSILSRTDREHDLPANRQLRHQPRRRGIQPTTHPRLRDRRTLPHPFKLALEPTARRLPRVPWRARHRRHRHPRPHQTSPLARRHARLCHDRTQCRTSHRNRTQRAIDEGHGLCEGSFNAQSLPLER